MTGPLVPIYQYVDTNLRQSLSRGKTLSFKLHAGKEEEKF